MRRLEIITGQERRRRWSREQKAQITAESFVPGANVAAVARRYGVSGGLLHYWRRCAREGAGEEELRFVPVVADESRASPPVPEVYGSSIEIEVEGVRIRLRGMVDGADLRTVLAVVRARD